MTNESIVPKLGYRQRDLKFFKEKFQFSRRTIDVARFFEEGIGNPHKKCITICDL